LVLGAPCTLPASTITLLDAPQVLGELLGGGSITAGDKRFDQFTYASTGDMPDAFAVNVMPFVDSDGSFGLRFQGGFVDLFDGDLTTGSPGNFSDASIGYQVTVLNPTLLISDVRLSGNPQVLGPEGAKTGFVGMSESFLPDDSLVLAIFDIQPGSTQSTDFASLAAPLGTLLVQKDILAFADAPGAATLSFIDQAFSQVQTVPEPSTISLLVLGLAAAWQVRRRSRIRA
jgi:hypothetical protein